MGYKIFQTEDRVENLYKEADKLTKNFTDFSIIDKRPDILLIIRLASGMPQRNFAKSIGVDRSILSHYELGIAKNMKDATKQKIIQNLSAMKNLDFSEIKIINNFKIFWELAKKGQNPDILRNRGREALKSKNPTIYERRIETILKNSKINFERESSLIIENMKFSFDFLIPNSKNPKIIIESKGIFSENKHSFRIVCYRIGYEVGYKSRLLKLEYPSVKKILIIESKIDKLPERVDEILRKENDDVLINPSNDEISHLFSRYV